MGRPAATTATSHGAHPVLKQPTRASRRLLHPRGHLPGVGLASDREASEPAYIDGGGAALVIGLSGASVFRTFWAAGALPVSRSGR